jgi:hypothetical protein
VGASPADQRRDVVHAEARAGATQRLQVVFSTRAERELLASVRDQSFAAWR